MLDPFTDLSPEEILYLQEQARGYYLAFRSEDLPFILQGSQCRAWGLLARNLGALKKGDPW